MKRWALLFVAASASVGVGCSSDKQARRGSEGGPEFALNKRAHGPARPGQAAEMRVDNELGVLEGREVEDTLAQHFDDIRGCYGRAGKAQRYAGGKVLLRFMVDGDGRATDVLVVESNLGSYDVERCLVAVGRRVVFDPPKGRKPTTFEYPVEFRSTEQVAVLEIDGLKIERDIATFMPQLAGCGRLAADDATAIMYIEPNGFPGSVGLAASSPIDEDAGDCVVQTIRRWRMSASLPGRVLRATFAIPPVIAPPTTAAAEGPRRAVSSASGRRKRR